MTADTHVADGSIAAHAELTPREIISRADGCYWLVMRFLTAVGQPAARYLSLDEACRHLPRGRALTVARYYRRTGRRAWRVAA